HLPFRHHEKFDIIYAGNLFHHVDIPLSMKSILSHMNRDSILVCWEPVRYNPVINIYRKIATRVRSYGERPLGLSEIQYMKKFFKESRVQWFWLTSLILFVYMFCIERRNPNKERFWKSIVKEGPQRAWAYTPLAAIDRALLTLFPFLKPLCWNVVIYLKNPHETR
ncbi:MAG: SAM-dependent methyltransferase, partial [Patescibacteria group bacterium]